MATDASLHYNVTSGSDDAFLSYPPKPSRSPSKEATSDTDLSKEAVPNENVPRSHSAVPLWLSSVTGLALAISLGILILTTGFIAYIFANRVFFSSAYVYVNVPNNRILLFSSVISRVPPLLPQVLMSVAAIGFGYDWLTSSLHDGPDELTPEQYSLIVRICSTAGLTAALDGVMYRRRAASGKTPTLPPILARAVLYLVIVTIAVNLVGVMDTVLHEGVTAAGFGLFSGPSPSPRFAFGRRINQTQCAINQESFDTGFTTPCASVVAGAHEATLMNYPEALATASNSSSINEVAVVDGVALMLDRQRGQKTFTATTLGWYTSCKPVSVQCALTADSGASTPYACIDYPAFQGDVENLAIGSSTVAVYTFNSTGTIQTGGMYDVGAWSQPVEYGIVFADVGDEHIIDRQIISGQHPFYAVLLWCESNILDVTYHHEPLRYPAITIQSYELANPNDTFTVTGAYTKGFGENLLGASTGHVLATNGSTAFANVFANTLSSVGIALAAGMFEPAPNLYEYSTSVNVTGARVNLPILFAFLASLILLAALCAYIGFASRRPDQGLAVRNETEEIPASHLAAMRLTTPATLVQQLFPDPSVAKTTAMKESDLFQEDLDEERLKVGVRTDRPGFGITRRRQGVAELHGQRVE